MGVSSIAAGSVIVKHSVNTAMYPRTMLSSTAQKIDLGRVSDASLISSAALSQLSCCSTQPRIRIPTHMYSAVKAKHRTQRSK